MSTERKKRPTDSDAKQPRRPLPTQPAAPVAPVGLIKPKAATGKAPTSAPIAPPVGVVIKKALPPVPTQAPPPAKSNSSSAQQHGKAAAKPAAPAPAPPVGTVQPKAGSAAAARTDGSKPAKSVAAATAAATAADKSSRGGASAGKASIDDMFSSARERLIARVEAAEAGEEVDEATMGISETANDVSLPVGDSFQPDGTHSLCCGISCSIVLYHKIYTCELYCYNVISP